MNLDRSFRRRKAARGATTVEFALVFPLIILFFTFTFEVCRVLMLQHTADTAAYEAARSAMVPGATAAEAEQVAQLLLDNAGLTLADIHVTPVDITDETALITVEVSIPVNENSWIAPSQFANFVVSSEVTLMCERPPLVKLAAMTDLSAKKDRMKNNTAGL
ncbi:TadE-like protein [Stieleria maiorica]|uniref:TadE-like protein n=1 Tax=Stieleria maiorica TaxID=2795974 RepID=A0A5B9MN61_9BACT|nr:TadE/TadG family type IV pilus assembly protein [Stieleria maiorica]QEG00298.1 TadE-like protein [Stieleria maiorica]